MDPLQSVSPQPMLPPPAHHMHPVRWSAIAILVILALLVIAFLGYQGFVSQKLFKKLPAANQTLHFTETGVTERVALLDSALFELTPIYAGDALILESLFFPLQKDEKIALANVPGTPGTVLGLIHADGTFEPKLSDGTLKVDLQVTVNGMAVYSTLMHPVSFDADIVAAPEDLERSPQDVEGHADGPIDDGIPFKTSGTSNAPASANGMLYTYDVTHGGAPRALGEGKNPRILSDGTLIALSSEGVVKVNFSNGTRTVLVPYHFGNGIGSTISSDGSVVLFHVTGNTISSLYVISAGSGTPAGSVVSSVPVFGAVFADDSHLFLRTGKTTVMLYNLSNDSAQVQPPTATLPIIFSK